MKRRKFIAATVALLISPQHLWAQGWASPNRFPELLSCIREVTMRGAAAYAKGARLRARTCLVEYRHYAETPGSPANFSCRVGGS